MRIASSRNRVKIFNVCHRAEFASLRRQIRFRWGMCHNVSSNSSCQRTAIRPKPRRTQLKSLNFPPENLNLDAIRAALHLIAPRIHRTPVITCASLDQIAGARLFFKCENLQKTGSFKIRGATNAVFSLTDEEAKFGVAAPSSGNHAAALAQAARWRGIPAYIVMPRNSSPAKKERSRSLRRANHRI